MPVSGNLRQSFLNFKLRPKDISQPVIVCNRDHIFTRRFFVHMKLLLHGIATHILKQLLPLLLAVLFAPPVCF